jgi:hypothetical protein
MKIKHFLIFAYASLIAQSGWATGGCKISNDASGLPYFTNDEGFNHCTSSQQFDKAEELMKAIQEEIKSGKKPLDIGVKGTLEAPAIRVKQSICRPTWQIHHQGLMFRSVMCWARHVPSAETSRSDSKSPL